MKELFDPCANLRASGQILTRCYEQSVQRYGANKQALHAALSCYNSGSFHAGFSNGYVKKVLAHAKTFVPSILPENEKNASLSLKNKKIKKHLKEEPEKDFMKKYAFEE